MKICSINTAVDLKV